MRNRREMTWSDPDWHEPDDLGGGSVAYVFHKTKTTKQIDEMSKKKIKLIIQKADDWYDRASFVSKAEYICAVGCDYKEQNPEEFIG